MTNDPDIGSRPRLVDYVFRRLALDHLPIEQREALGIRSIDERKETAAAEAGREARHDGRGVVAAVKAEAPPKLPIVESSGVHMRRPPTRRSATRAARRCSRPARATSALLRLDERLLVRHAAGRATLRPHALD